jgi:hypothetical protein
MNYYYVLHKSDKGLFAYPKGRPRKDGNQAKGGIQLQSSDDIETSILKIRRDKLIPDSSEWMVLLSFATNEMIRYMSILKSGSWIVPPVCMNYISLNHMSQVILT